MTNITRRTFLRQTTLATGAVFGLQGLIARGAAAEAQVQRGPLKKDAGGDGPLLPTAAKNTGETLLALPGALVLQRALDASILVHGLLDARYHLHVV